MASKAASLRAIIAPVLGVLISYAILRAWLILPVTNREPSATTVYLIADADLLPHLSQLQLTVKKHKPNEQAAA
jgi:hypothetical protein